uniref:HAT C-terminal dimerisation domain-containing protein n=1 Tax=Acrobeloides nanus TaxID=290746 RepID=A0A914D9C3_9BILA
KYNKSDNLDDFYDDGPPSPFSKDNPQKADPIDAEVDNYLHRASCTYAAQFDNCLQFWRQKSKDLPRLAVMARRLLPILSSASTERLWSFLAIDPVPSRKSRDFWHPVSKFLSETRSRPGFRPSQTQSRPESE